MDDLRGQDKAKAQPIVHRGPGALCPEAQADGVPCEEFGVDSGPGALCPEAQADGVPCEELGVDCEDCVKAQPTAVEPSKRRADLA